MSDAGGPPVRRGLLTVAVVLGSVMQVFDTSLASVALPHIQGTLSTTQDQISWILTAYVIAVAVFTPPTGWLRARLGRRRFLLIAISGFTVTSVLAGMSDSLLEMVIWRFLQGGFGGVLAPLAQSTLLDVYPREDQGAAMGWWTMGMMFGPIFGPAIGGYITDSFNWRWVFYINVPIGALAFTMIAAFVPESERSRERRFDGFGFFALAAALICLQLVLDRGERLDWFDSSAIVALVIASAAFFYVFVVRILTDRNPFIDPAMLANRSFVIGLILIFMQGALTLGILALLPPFTQHLLGYPATLAGLVISPRGICTMIASFVAGWALRRMDPRPMVVLGILLCALSTWQISEFTMATAPMHIVIASCVQGFGYGFFYVALTTATFATLTLKFRGDGTALYALSRNLGSSVGISVLVSIFVRGAQAEHARLAEHVGRYSDYFRHHVVPDAWSVDTIAGLARLDAEVTRQAQVIAYAADFRFITAILLATVPLVFLMEGSARRSRPPTPERAPGSA